MDPRIIGRGPRVYLREPVATDEEEFLSGVRASRELHVPWVYPVCEPEAFRKWLEDGRNERALRLLACSSADHAVVGIFILSEIVRDPFQNAYLGYWAISPHDGKGYMKEALELVLRHAFGPLGLHRIEANIQPGNDGSIALARSAGFRREGFSPRYLQIGGQWRDHERWAITVEDRPT